MKRYYIIRVALFLGLSGLLHSCVVKNDNPETAVDLRFHVDSRAVTEPGTPAEDKITSIRLMVFNWNGKLEVKEYKTDPAGFTSVPVEVDVTVLSGRKTFCIIANEPDITTPLLDAVATIDELRAIRFGDHTIYNDGSAPALPMTAMKTEYISGTRDVTDPLRMTLKRAVGKVRMSITKEPAHNITAKLASVQVKQTPSISSLVEGNPVSRAEMTTYAVDHYAESSFSPDVITYSTPIEMIPLYLYEYHWGKGTPEDAIAFGYATYLEVIIHTKDEINYPLDPWQVHTYRFPLIGSIDNGENVYEVRRNTIANFKLILAGEGIHMSYTVLDWEEDEYGKVPGQDDGNTKVEDWVLPALVEYEHELQ